MEINGGCHSCDLHQGSGSSSPPKENTAPSQAGGGAEGGHKKRKDGHQKLSILEATKAASSIWRHLKDPQQPEGTQFGVFVFNFQKERSLSLSEIAPHRKNSQA